LSSEEAATKGRNSRWCGDLSPGNLGDVADHLPGRTTQALERGFDMTSALVKLQTRAHCLLQDKKDRGATAVEYGLLVALIAAVIIGTVVTLGTQINTAFQTIVNELP
jgi:pilus assembly protein Flp/PilA